MYDAWTGPRIIIGITYHSIVEKLISVLVEQQHPHQKEIEVIT
jgi:hypothetical protein